jgi:uncharacterized damage-inducible protein DinB
MQPLDLDQLLAYYDSVHARTRRVILTIPPSHLEWRPADAVPAPPLPGAAAETPPAADAASPRFSFGDLVRHLAALERFMFAENVHGRPSCYPGHGRDLADGWDLTLAFYDRCSAESRALFAALTPEQLAGRCTTPGGASLPVWKWLRAMFEHEAHHRGQIYLMLGLLGVATPPLYGLTSEEVQARSRSAAPGM